MHEKQLAASTRHACLSLSLSCFAKKKAYRPLRRCKVVFRCFIYARCQSMHGRRQASYQCKQLVALSSPKLSFPAVFDSLLIFSCCAPPFGTHINNDKSPSAWIQVHTERTRTRARTEWIDRTGKAEKKVRYGLIEAKKTIWSKPVSGNTSNQRGSLALSI